MHMSLYLAGHQFSYNIWVLSHWKKGNPPCTDLGGDFGFGFNCISCVHIWRQSKFRWTKHSYFCVVVGLFCLRHVYGWIGVSKTVEFAFTYRLRLTPCTNMYQKGAETVCLSCIVLFRWRRFKEGGGRWCTEKKEKERTRESRRIRITLSCSSSTVCFFGLWVVEVLSPCDTSDREFDGEAPLPSKDQGWGKKWVEKRYPIMG